jgi:hypothetical protein
MYCWEMLIVKQHLVISSNLRAATLQLCQDGGILMKESDGRLHTRAKAYDLRLQQVINAPVQRP